VPRPAISPREWYNARDTMAEEGVHEIHLNGKQLVFMFMATTVVAVVIFLSGVMVGRGVPPRNAMADRSADVASAGIDPTVSATGAGETSTPRASGTAPVGSSPAGSSPAGSNSAPVTTQETLTYAERLEAPTPPRETLKEIADTPVAASATRPANKPADKPAVTPAAFAEPPGTGWAVQVMALPASQRGDAEALARRLAAKGYPSFVVPRGNRFAVRVGKYPNQREAEAISARLKKEEQFDPWVTR
jgi:cell division septation protein DedD